MLEREGSIKTSGVGGERAKEQLGTSLYLTEVGYKAVGGFSQQQQEGNSHRAVQNLPWVMIT